MFIPKETTPPQQTGSLSRQMVLKEMQSFSTDLTANGLPLPQFVILKVKLNLEVCRQSCACLRSQPVWLI